MNFVSLVFLVFLAIVIPVYYLVPQRYRWIVLLVASYVFYSFYNVLLLPLIVFITLITYGSARLMEEKGKKKRYLVFTLIATLGCLFVFKYINFSIKTSLSIINLFGGNVEFKALDIILPMGISFYTFQTLSYVIDVYNSKAKAEKNFFVYNLFVIYFPQLVAGPIERVNDLLPQLKEGKKADWNDITQGISLILIGYFKKIAIADMLGYYVDQVYGNVSSYSGTILIIATIMFAFQILCDFDGYSTIAMGVSSLLGIKLSKNFDHPYLATNIKDFWGRWHMTLTRWFRDYVYIPLGGNRKGKWRKYLNIFIVFILSGLWHGANLTFLIWGLIHGIALIAYNLISDNVKYNHNNKAIKAVGWFVTSLVCLAGWVFFRSQSIGEALLIYQKIFTSFSIAELTSVFTNSHIVIYLLSIPAVLLLINKIPALNQNSNALRDDRHNPTALMIYLILLVCIIIARVYLIDLGASSSFIYFEF